MSDDESYVVWDMDSQSRTPAWGPMSKQEALDFVARTPYGGNRWAQPTSEADKALNGHWM